MRKSLCMIPAVLLFTVLGSASARADTIIASGSTVTAIDGVTINGTTYDVTFMSNVIGTTFLGNASGASAADDAILADLNGSSDTSVSPAAGLMVPLYGVFEGSTTYCGFSLSFSSSDWIACTANSTVFGGDVDTAEATWTVFTAVAPVATPERGSATLALSGLGLIGLIVMRKCVAQRHPQAT